MPCPTHLTPALRVLSAESGVRKLRNRCTEWSGTAVRKPLASGGVRRGWSRLFGRAPNALLYALVVVVRNVRLVLAAEDREHDAARRAAMGLSPLTRRRRRRRHPESVPSEPVASVPDPPPG